MTGDGGDRLSLNIASTSAILILFFSFLSVNSKFINTMSDNLQCFLMPFNHTRNKIFLKDMTEICLGRSSTTTRIKDVACSRKQVSVMANYKTRQVTIRHLGFNPSRANGVLLQNKTHVLNHGEILEFLPGVYAYKVKFLQRTKDLKDLNSDTNFNSDGMEVTSNLEVSHMDQELTPSTTSITNFNDNSDNIIDKIGPPTKNALWESIDAGTLLIYTTSGVRSSSKIASFDLDGTLIKTKSGRVFPKDKDDWVIGFSQVKQKLSSQIDKGYKIVIFTNQAGIGRHGKTKEDEFKNKIEKIIDVLSLPVQVFVATSHNIYRKPIPGMWRVLKEQKNSNFEINMNKSFYVGDGAGRVLNWAPGTRSDFSCADRLFALNLGLTFLTPEEYFLNQQPGKFLLPEFNPAQLIEADSICDESLFKSSKEVIILVGYPAAGKTFFTEKCLLPRGYKHVNRDTLGSWQRCLSAMEQALSNNKSVVIDNTNPDRESRERFITKARAMNVPCRCFVMSTSIEHARHNNKFRELTDKTHVPVNDMVINTHKSKLQNPTLDEGFQDIITINFNPKFDDLEMKKLYHMYLR